MVILVGKSNEVEAFKTTMFQKICLSPMVNCTCDNGNEMQEHFA